MFVAEVHNAEKHKSPWLMLPRDQEQETKTFPSTMSLKLSGKKYSAIFTYNESNKRM
jgi:hypothetical protein